MKSIDILRREAVSKWGVQIGHSEIPVIFLGTASCGRAAGAMDVLQTIQETLVDLAIDARIVQVGCIGPAIWSP